MLSTCYCASLRALIFRLRAPLSLHRLPLFLATNTFVLILLAESFMMYLYAQTPPEMGAPKLPPGPRLHCTLRGHGQPAI